MAETRLPRRPESSRWGDRFRQRAEDSRYRGNVSRNDFRFTA